MGYGVRHLRFADYRVTPWKNGAGVTREIAAAAASVGSETPPDWRISMATITEDAPFSTFPGIARTLGVVDGAGIELVVAGRTRLLRIGDAPEEFAGDIPASARPLQGPVLDLNLMVDPSRTMGQMRPIGLGTHDLAGLSWFVVSLVDGLAVRLNDQEPLALPRLDTARLDLRSGPLARLTLTQAADASDTDASGAPRRPAANDAASDTPVAYLLSIWR